MIYEPAAGGWLVTLLVALLLGSCGGGGEALAPPGQVAIGGGDGALTLVSLDSAAGAFSSLTWQGMEFLDAKDHGRLLQSAVQFEGISEAINPTEGGASGDGPATRAGTSVLLSRQVEGGHLASAAQMAYWFMYGGQRLSNVVLRRDVQISGNTIAYVTRFEIPAAEIHSQAQFEALTAYMPLAFSRMFTLQNGALTQLAKPAIGSWGEIDTPLVFSTADGSHAMGVRSADAVIYGYWTFADCVKWNLMYRTNNPQPTTFTQTLVVGTLEQVRAAMSSD
jgi:hypothetical protein